MQRCSKCDFIYEDDQHLCDMDGHELVYEPTLQGLQINAVARATRPLATATRPPAQPVNSGARRQLLAAAVAILIATILSVGYSGFTRDYAPQNTKAPSTSVIAVPESAPDQPPTTPAVSPTPSPSQSPRLEKPSVSPTTTSPIESSTTPSRTTASSRETVRSSAKANHKKESGIRGFLSKTGKILKKPFKKF